MRPGTLGRAVEGFEVKVADDDGRELPPGEVGGLWVKGRSRAIGYWQQMEKTAAAFRGEWYVTGDLVKRDAEGYFTHCGPGRRDAQGRRPLGGAAGGRGAACSSTRR